MSTQDAMSTQDPHGEQDPDTGGTAAPAHEPVEGVVTTDPGPQQAPGQGERSPQEQGTLPPEDPDGEPGFA